MIIAPLGPEQVAFRMHSPRWAFEPLSGAGAGNSGGRLNRIGIDALYLALDPETAIAEYRQDDPLVRPGLLVSYRITIGQAVDFRAGYDPAHWDPLWQDLGCNWQGMSLLDEVEPPSWALGTLVRAAGIVAVLFPSTRRVGGVNLVVYPDLLAAGDQLLVHDPNCELPRDQSSWE